MKKKDRLLKKLRRRRQKMLRGQYVHARGCVINGCIGVDVLASYGMKRKPTLEDAINEFERFKEF